MDEYDAAVASTPKSVVRAQSSQVTERTAELSKFVTAVLAEQLHLLGDAQKTPVPPDLYRSTVAG